MIVNQNAYPNLAAVTDAVLAVYPDHLSYLNAGLGARSEELLRHCEVVATAIVKVANTVEGGLRTLAEDYKFVCQEVVFQEEIHFRRTGRYRLTTFAEAYEQVYSNEPYMRRYMNGVLLSHVMWENHCVAQHHCASAYLPSLPEGSHHLEIGPGHGLMLYFATLNNNIAEVSGWDVSQTSLEMSRQALKIMGAPRGVHFEEYNIGAPKDLGGSRARFDSVVCSEVLEHLENPSAALDTIFELCKPGGKAWLNVPANSPTPDHLFLLKSPEELHEMVQKAGFDIVEIQNFPMTGYTLDRAIRKKLSISCVVVGQRPLN